MVRTNFDTELAKKIVKTIPMFAGFSDSELSELLERTGIYMYHRGETVFLGDEESLQMYIILKGRVKVVENSPDGRERIMAIRHSGDYFGDMGLLDGKTDYATVIAMQPSKMLLITKGVFDDFFLKNSAALQSMIMLLCGRLRESWLFQTIIGTNDAESKIRVTLARYGKTLGIKDRSGVIINTVLTHQSIADRVLITRETATRVLKRLRDQNEIEMVGRHIKLLDTFFYKNKQCELYQTLKAMENSP